MSDPSKSRHATGDPYTSRRLFGRLWHDYLRHQIPAMSLVAVLMVIEGSTLGALSYMLQPLFEKVFAGADPSAIWWVGAAIFGLFLIRAITSILSKTMLSRIAQRTSTAMQADLLRHILTLDSRFFQENPPGALIERVQGDTMAIQGIWITLISAVGRDGVALVSLFAVAISIDPVWTMVALVGTPLLILPIASIQRYVRRKTTQSRRQASLRATRLDEIFHGIIPIKLNRMEGYQSGRFERIIDTIVKAEVKNAAGRSTIPALIDVVTGLGFFAVLVLGGREIIAGEKTLAQFMSFFTAMALTFQPIRRLGDTAGTWQVAAASLERVYRLMDTLPSISPPAHPRLPAPGETEIRLQDVTLAYGEMPVLRGVTFTAEAGRTTALVGASGAGKSTVFNLLTRLVDAQSGLVTVGGVDIMDIPLPELRAMFSVVTQDAALFDETIRENITLGRQDVSDERLREVMDAAHVTEFVEHLPLGVDTPAGPRGSALSGGQRQRVAIARALLRDAPILLLDEATSALDARSEALVQAALDRLSVGRTTLVIAHRLSTIRDAHKIVVMDQGRVVDEGTHEELLSRDGLYAGLYRLQFQSTMPISVNDTEAGA
ncbi:MULTISPECIES: ABC transporter ATP-binding protein [unclassified Haematobacter]|uniref:ABC transporter ATP-binding protein n=1 Tax=unclassified Haematobacter TaxID=2640585 RepID=UPI0025BD4FA8|nr:MULTISPECIES: ABC transporter ATP-binding protein [unclassified Haematobacter]